MVFLASTQRVHCKTLSGRLICRLFVLILSLLAPMPAMTGAATGRTAGAGATSNGLNLSASYNRSSFVDSGFSATATITATAQDSSGTAVAINPGDVTWTVVSSSITAAWWGNRSVGAMNGLCWGSTAISLAGYYPYPGDPQRMDMSGDIANGGGGESTKPDSATAQLTDIVGSRSVTVKAVMTIGGQQKEGTAQVTFGPGPLSVFKGKPIGSMDWENAGSKCGSKGDLNIPGYQPATKLPTIAQLQNVSGTNAGGRQGAAHAAGWPDDTYGNGWFVYWTGEAYGDGIGARYVFLDDGGAAWTYATGTDPVAVCLP